MAEMVVAVLLYTMLVYLVMGMLFTIPFQWKGMAKIDEGVHGSTVAFRIIIIPGCILLWPVLWVKWVRAIKSNKSK